MQTNLDDVPTDAYGAGLQHARALKGFYSHLATYAVVISLLAILDYLSGPSWWVQWPLVGWGIALVLHALGVFVFDTRFGSDWERRKAQEYASHHR